MTPPQEWEEADKWTSAAQAFFLLSFFFAAVVFGADFRLPPALKYEEIAFIDLPPPSPAPESAPIKTSATALAPQSESSADVALKKKREEEQRRQEAEERARKKREEELRLAEQRQELERKQREERARLAEEKKKRIAEEKERRLAEARAEENRREREAAEARRETLGRLKNSYIGRIMGRIEPYLITPPEARGVANLEVVVEVRLNADGELDGLPRVLETSGVSEYDDATYRAVLKASPLPMPKEPALLQEFRVLTLRITPKQ